MRLLFIGDSLIEFFDWETRFAEHEVYNFGIAGETVEGLYRRLPAVIAKVPFPDFVFIMSGINNLAMEDRGFLKPYGGAIGRLKQAWPSVRIYLHSLLPVGTPFLSNDDVRRMNGELRLLAEREGIGYADIHRLFLDESGAPCASCLLEDGVHVSDEGYRIWSARIEEIIARTTGD